MDFIIRGELKEDYGHITRVNDLAFGQKHEGMLIDTLRKTDKFDPNLSLVALVKGTVVGHILFYPIFIRSQSSEYVTLALAPMSVLPDFQRQNVGSKLIRKGIHTTTGLGFKSAIVLGHPLYYPRFGFEPASTWHCCLS
jgi:putative acetyltransferase